MHKAAESRSGKGHLLMVPSTTGDQDSGDEDALSCFHDDTAMGDLVMPPEGLRSDQVPQGDGEKADGGRLFPEP